MDGYKVLEGSLTLSQAKELLQFTRITTTTLGAPLLFFHFVVPLQSSTPGFQDRDGDWSNPSCIDLAHEIAIALEYRLILFKAHLLSEDSPTSP